MDKNDRNLKAHDKVWESYKNRRKQTGGRDPILICAVIRYRIIKDYLFCKKKTQTIYIFIKNEPDSSTFPRPSQSFPSKAWAPWR